MQPELVTEDMRNWSRFIRNQTVEIGGAVIDTSRSDIEQSIGEVGALINNKLRERLSSN
jgi:hypothetical protein